MTESSAPQPRDEPVFNVPGPVLIVVASILGFYALQSWIGWNWPVRFGLIPVRLWQGDLLGLVTSIGVHGEWMHAGSNAVGALAFGAPLARRLGGQARGYALFLGFFLICGVISGLGYALIHPESSIPLIGASGAVFGLIGAATRLMNPWGVLEPLRSPRVISMTGAWVGVNVLVAVLGFDPATGVRGIAWEAHLIGLACGLLGVGAWLRLWGIAPAQVPSPGPWSGPPGGEH
ncbi:MAG: rhomboid family intramembrane serine protease [Caulobacterales bacterium]|nr:rhomboid family intramembrane serine protease [Caulobacterales bacterium]